MGKIIPHPRSKIPASDINLFYQILKEEIVYEEGCNYSFERRFDDLVTKYKHEAYLLLRDTYITYKDVKLSNPSSNILYLLATIDGNRRFLFYDVILHALYNDNVELVDLAVKCIESWSAVEYLSELKKIYFIRLEIWLKNYIDNVICMLENTK